MLIGLLYRWGRGREEEQEQQEERQQKVEEERRGREEVKSNNPSMQSGESGSHMPTLLSHGVHGGAEPST